MQVNGDFNITTSTGNSISLTDGIIKVADNQGNSITMNASGIQLGDNANFSAVLGESLNALLMSMITIFNTHTHVYSPGGGTPTPTAPTQTPMMIQDILSQFDYWPYCRNRMSSLYRLSQRMPAFLLEWLKPDL